MNKDLDQKHHTARDQDDDNDDDSLFDALEKEDDSAYRAHRIEQLNAEFSAAKNNRSSNPTTTLVEDGLLPTLRNDQAVLDFTTLAHRCVVHFAHPDFARCGVMDEHIRALAAQHHDIRFARVDVRDTPFVVEKLSIRVLPCVIGFKDGLGVERVVGFEGLGAGGRDGAENFSTATLEKRLLWKGVLSQAKFKTGNDGSDISDGDSGDEGFNGRRRGAARRTIRSGNIRNRGEDNDDDWD
ncbi:thioredoxin domain-containing protein [Aspergillus clavatus NRRL 1]|uniref:NTP binding protein, putative n=1 Tax=Aspergillus clavatus (strain ATCC 1007 / CBS 513.65 / DSM 816 / NCTC 3887 / NRRL 1 / QM 1276 / 107) TaxID=344612 RepID=A1C9R5_ASPCL|nr:NTP binding protein, putative [Aspergillus clavatus NRRL 1]EAW12483.1 NTP binding protein, putative [Aspergillus clavatus NRRL 1]